VGLGNPMRVSGIQKRFEQTVAVLLGKDRIATVVEQRELLLRYFKITFSRPALMGVVQLFDGRRNLRVIEYRLNQGPESGVTCERNPSNGLPVF